MSRTLSDPIRRTPSEISVPSCRVRLMLSVFWITWALVSTK